MVRTIVLSDPSVMIRNSGTVTIHPTGGGLHGCMGAVNKGAPSLNGEILGVIHEKWCVDGEEDPLIPDMIVVGEQELVGEING